MIALSVLIAMICIMLVGAILIQNPKGGGIDATFGGGQANQMFGAAGSTDLIEKITWGLAIALFVLCIIAGVLANGADVNNADMLLNQ